MRQYSAYPKNQIDQLIASVPGAAEELRRNELVMTEDLAREVADIRMRTDYILYHKYLPLATVTTHSFFEDLGANVTDYWTNIKVGGRIPFSGNFKIIGLGMLIEPMLTNGKVADITAILDGHFNFHVGSGETSTLKGPLAVLYSQRNVCCFVASASGQEAVTEIISNSPFTGKFGFLPLPNAPRIRDNVNFKIEVTWNTTWAADSGVKMGLYIFGKREFPFAE